MVSDREAVYHFLSQVIRSIAGFIATLLIAQIMGADGLGVYVTAVALVFWLKIPVNSVATAVSKRASEGRQGTITAGIVVNLCYAALASSAILVLQGYVNAYVGIETALLLAGLLFGNTLYDTVDGGLIGTKLVAFSGWLRTTEQVLRVGLQFILLLHGYGILGLLAGHIISLCVGSIAGLFRIRDGIRVPSWADFSSLGSYARFSWLGTLKSSALDWADVAILGIYVSSNLVGIYRVCWTVAAILVLASNSIERALFPAVSSLNVEENTERIHSLLNDGLVFTGIFLIPGFFGSALIGDRVLRIYSTEFAMGTEILLILVGARILIAFGRQFGNVLNAIDRPDVMFKLNGTYIGANIVLNVVLVKSFGWYGAAYATAISGLIVLAGGYFTLSRILGKPAVPVYPIGAQILSSIGMGITVYLSRQVIPAGKIGTIVLILLGAATYSVFLLGISSKVRRRVLKII